MGVMIQNKVASFLRTTV